MKPPVNYKGATLRNRRVDAVDDKIDAIAIPQQIFRCGIEGKCFYDPRNGPPVVGGAKDDKGLARRSRNRIEPSPSGRGTRAEGAQGEGLEWIIFRCACPHPAFGHPLPVGEGSCPKNFVKKTKTYSFVPFVANFQSPSRGPASQQSQWTFRHSTG